MAAAAYGLYVAGITVVSRSETHEGDRRGLVAGLTLQDLALLGLAAARDGPSTLPAPRAGPPADPPRGITRVRPGRHGGQPGRRRRDQSSRRSRSIQKTVKTGILSLVWLNVGLVAAVRGIEPAAIVAALWVPAFLLGRWLYST